MKKYFNILMTKNFPSGRFELKRYNSYINVIKNINHKRTDIEFKKNGKLAICLIEFRILPEIEYVINSILKVYDPSEIGLTLVFGNINKDYIYSITKNMKNINYIYYNQFDNVTIRQYNKILKWNNFYKNFINFEFVLIIQTDALIIRKIDDIYFNYDYIGAPWSNIEDSHGGNGGFSLRKVEKMLETTTNNIKLSKISGLEPNEDLFFSFQENYNYCNNRKLHQEFSVETEYNENSIGIHKIYVTYLEDIEFNSILSHITNNLIN